MTVGGLRTRNRTFLVLVEFFSQTRSCRNQSGRLPWRIILGTRPRFESQVPREFGYEGKGSGSGNFRICSAIIEFCRSGTVSLAVFIQVLFILGLEMDLDAVTKEDVFGRILQDHFFFDT